MLLPPSMPSWREAIRVDAFSFPAATWSIEMPFLMPAPSVFTT